VAVVDAVGVGIGLLALSVPPAALVSLGAFIPNLAALLAGTAAVLIAWSPTAWSRR
jgi:putative heme transporter